MIRYILIILSIIFSLSNCKQVPTKEANSQAILEKPKILTPSKTKETSVESASYIVSLDFDDFTLIMPDIEIYRNDSIPGKDTIEISPELGYGLDSQIVMVELKPNIKSIEVFESYKTVLSIMDEGPHLDLYDWKGYESNWTSLKTIKDKVFMMRLISEKEAARFPDFTKEKLVEVAESVEKGWGNTLTKPSYGTWKDHYWIGVGIRRLKFVLTDSEGKSITKYLVAYIPMGC